MTAPTIWMRQRDRLPLIAIAIETDDGTPVDLTGAKVWLRLRMVDGSPLFYDGYPWAGSDWYRVGCRVDVAGAPNGLITYDWSNDEANHVDTGPIEVAAEAQWTDGKQLIAPTDGHTYIIMRPETRPRPGEIPATYGAEMFGSGAYGDPSTPA